MTLHPLRNWMLLAYFRRILLGNCRSYIYTGSRSEHFVFLLNLEGKVGLMPASFQIYVVQFPTSSVPAFGIFLYLQKLLCICKE